jgi:hypothetical protein
MALIQTVNLAIANQATPPSRFTDLVLNARVELYACLQLLADRARFVTGASWSAVALCEGDKFIYRAAAGENAPEIGAEANVNPGVALELHLTIQSRGKFLVVKVVRNSKTAGVLQLVSSSAEFSEQDINSVVRLSEMVGTAIEHMHAAERSEEAISAAANDSLKSQIPLLWHAPAGSEQPSSRIAEPIQASAPASVRTCESCGFPVSPNRAKCVDCEERGIAPATQLFSTKDSESWINAHGYTIASLLVSALVAALIYWLR